jgi:pimeloyl-ACP methyl ester carboxylesterase
VSLPLTLAVRELGGAGAPLVVLHGLLGSARNWQSAGVALAARGHRVLAPDLRNHGVSPWGDDCSYAALAGDVVACLERLALGPVHLVGHSMGGKAAMRLAVARPDLVARLTIVDIAPRAYADRVRVEFAAMNALDLAAVTSRKDAEARLTAQVPEWGMRQFILTNLGQDPAGRWRWTVNPGQPVGAGRGLRRPDPLHPRREIGLYPRRGCRDDPRALSRGRPGHAPGERP